MPNGFQGHNAPSFKRGSIAVALLKPELVDSDRLCTEVPNPGLCFIGFEVNDPQAVLHRDTTPELSLVSVTFAEFVPLDGANGIGGNIANVLCAGTDD